MKIKEILEELISIKDYMEEKDAFYGYGQISDLIGKIQEEHIDELIED